MKTELNERTRSRLQTPMQHVSLPDLINMAYLRFVLRETDIHSGVAAGIFQRAYELRDSLEIPEEDRTSLRDQLNWFGANLAEPERFNRTTSKGYYRRAARGIAWFRDTAKEHLTRMHELKRILEASGHFVRLICQDRVGYIVYEDQFQVIAEAFSDTRTE